MLIYCTFITNLTVISYFFLKLISYTLEISKITKIALALENTGKKKNVKVKTEFLRRRRKIVASSNEHALCHEKSIEISLSLSLLLFLSVSSADSVPVRSRVDRSVDRRGDYARVRGGSTCPLARPRRGLALRIGPRCVHARTHTHTHARRSVTRL